MLSIMTPTVEAVTRTDAGLASQLRVSVMRLARRLRNERDPELALGLGAISVLGVLLRQEFVRAARAKGASPLRVLVVHGLRNALVPILTVIGLQFGFLFGGVIVIETVFGLPGMGRFLVVAVQQRDYPTIQGLVMTFALAFLLVNLLVDVGYALIDPRIRVG